MSPRRINMQSPTCPNELFTFFPGGARSALLTLQPNFTYILSDLVLMYRAEGDAPHRGVEMHYDGEFDAAGEQKGWERGKCARRRQ